MSSVKGGFFLAQLVLHQGMGKPYDSQSLFQILGVLLMAFAVFKFPKISQITGVNFMSDNIC